MDLRRAAALDAALTDYFNPWVQALGLKLEAFSPTTVTLLLPQNDQIMRMGDMLCGQAMMAAADTGMVIALINHFGEFLPCTTVHLNSTFLKPLSGQDALVEVGLVRVGKTLAFGEVDIRGAHDGKSVYRASVTYALLESRASSWANTVQ